MVDLVTKPWTTSHPSGSDQIMAWSRQRTEWTGPSTPLAAGLKAIGTGCIIVAFGAFLTALFHGAIAMSAEGLGTALFAGGVGGACLAASSGLHGKPDPVQAKLADDSDRATSSPAVLPLGLEALSETLGTEVSESQYVDLLNRQRRAERSGRM